MFLNRWRKLPGWIACSVALLLWTDQVIAQGEFSSANKQVGKAAVEYLDKSIHVVAAYYYSQQNHDSRWLLLETAISTTDDIVIHRKDISLVAPSGRQIPLATQQRIGEDVTRIEQLLQNASSVTHPVASYFAQRDRVEDMRLFRLPFGGVIHDEFVVDRDHVAVGRLFFESPTGAWDKGTYSLEVRHSKGTAKLPVRLE